MHLVYSRVVATIVLAASVHSAASLQAQPDDALSKVTVPHGGATGLTSAEAEALRLAIHFSARGVARAKKTSAMPWRQRRVSLVQRMARARRRSENMSALQLDDEFLDQRALPVGDKVLEGNGSDFVIAFVNIKNNAGNWGDLESTTEKGIPEIMAVNRDKAKAFGYRMVLRTAPTLGDKGYVPSEEAHCAELQLTREECRVTNERMNNNWEKEALLVDYLNQPGVKYVLALDSDAALVHAKHDAMRTMAAELERTGKEILIADEDWRPNGKGMLNGGLVFAKSTKFTKMFFHAIVQSHINGHDYKGLGPRCTSNEQLCLSASITEYPGLKEKLLVASGGRWNRHPCAFSMKGCKGGKAEDISTYDPNLEVVHFMGAAKSNAKRILHNLGILA